MRIAAPLSSTSTTRPKDASRLNLRQVHVIEAELIDYLQTLGFDVKVGDLV